MTTASSAQAGAFAELPESAPCAGDLKSTQTLLDACIHCGMCLSSCPTYVATGSEAESPRGRLYLMRQWENGRLEDAEALGEHLDNCLGCLNCQTACPSHVQYGQLLNRFREKLLPLRASGIAYRIKRFAFRWILPSPWATEAMAWSMRLYQKSGLAWLIKKTGILNPFPALANMEALMPQLEGWKQPPPLRPGMRFSPLAGTCAAGSRPAVVALHLGCLMNAIFRPIHWATIRVLQANGYTVLIPEQTCCGALAHHAGQTDLARPLAEENLARFSQIEALEAIVFNSAGCGAEMKEYAHLFTEKDEAYTQAKQLHTKVVDITELLARKPLLPFSHKVEAIATYHAACHLRHAQGIVEEPVTLLKGIPGLKLIPLTEAETCCGSAGIYNLEKPELAREVLDRKLNHLEATRAQWVITGNPGCHMQISYGLRQLEHGPELVLHPVEVLAMAYGFSREKHYQ